MGGLQYPWAFPKLSSIPLETILRGHKLGISYTFPKPGCLCLFKLKIGDTTEKRKGPSEIFLQNYLFNRSSFGQTRTRETVSLRSVILEQTATSRRQRMTPVNKRL
jgi:hypothetical protein